MATTPEDDAAEPTESFLAHANRDIMVNWRNRWPLTPYVTKKLTVLAPEHAEKLRRRLCATSAIGMHAGGMKAVSMLPIEASFGAREYAHMSSVFERDTAVSRTALVPGQASLFTIMSLSAKSLKHVLLGNVNLTNSSRRATTTHDYHLSDGSVCPRRVIAECHGLAVVDMHEVTFCTSARFVPDASRLLTIGRDGNIALFGRQVKDGDGFIMYAGIENWDDDGTTDINSHSRMFPPKLTHGNSLQEMCDEDHPVARSLLTFHPEIKMLMSAIRSELPHPDLVLVDMHILFFGKKRFEMHQDRHADYIGWNLLWTVITLLSDSDTSMRIAGIDKEIVYDTDVGDRIGTAIMLPSKLWHSSVVPAGDGADIKIVFFYGLKHTCSRKRKIEDNDHLFGCTCECEEELSSSSPED